VDLAINPLSVVLQIQTPIKKKIAMVLENVGPCKFRTRLVWDLICLKSG